MATGTATAMATATVTPTAIPTATGGVGLRGIRVDPQGLLQAGCVAGKEGTLDCSKPKSGADPGCFGGARIVDGVGGVEPKTSIAECNVVAKNSAAPEGIVRLGCRLPVYRRYVVADGDKLTVLASKEAFVQRFAPVTAPEEALSFALALTNAAAVFEAPAGMKMLVKDFAPTDVKSVADGFEVRVFEYQLCGCGPHETEEVVYLVKRSGDVSEVRRRKVWNNPKLDGVCVD